MAEEIEYPVRINRYLYLTGVTSRRKADELIKNGEVNINGRAAVIGALVHEGDKVTLSKQARALPKTYRYYAYNKPRGVVSHDPQHGERSAQEDANLPTSFIPLGRLDKDSEGLMILTDDTRIVDRILNPKFGHERTYEVTVDKKISNWFTRHMSEGVDIEGYMTKPAKVNRLADTKCSITLTEGKKHQIRRMAAALGYQIKSLKRTSLGPIKLGRMKKGEARELTEAEREALLALAGLGTK